MTNAFEVESAFRMELRPDDGPWLEPSFESTGGFVNVYPTPGMRHMRLGYIPHANPFVTKLASIATRAIRTHGCEAIYAFYLEPYGIAGCLAAM